MGIQRHRNVRVRSFARSAHAIRRLAPRGDWRSLSSRCRLADGFADADEHAGAEAARCAGLAARRRQGRRGRRWRNACAQLSLRYEDGLRTLQLAPVHT